MPYLEKCEVKLYDKNLHFQARVKKKKKKKKTMTVNLFHSFSAKLLIHFNRFQSTKDPIP